MGLLTGEKNKKMQSIHPKDKNNDWKDWDWNEEDFPNCHLNEKKEWEWDEQPKELPIHIPLTFVDRCKGDSEQNQESHP